MFWPFVKFICIYLKAREWDKQGDRQRSPKHWCTPKMHATATMGQTDARSWELNLSIPCWWQGYNHLSHHLLHPRMPISQRWKLGTEPQLKPTYSDIGYPIPSAILTIMPNAHPCFSISNLVFSESMGRIKIKKLCVQAGMPTMKQSTWVQNEGTA